MGFKDPIQVFVFVWKVLSFTTELPFQLLTSPFISLGSLLLIITRQYYALLGVSTACFRDEIQDQSLIISHIIFHKAITHSQFSGKNAMKKHGIGNTIPITALENYLIPLGLTLSALSILIVTGEWGGGSRGQCF